VSTMLLASSLLTGQILHPRLMVITLALPTPNTTNTKVEYAVEDLLEETRLSDPDNGANG
jgi:hypothetical protein